MRPSPDAEYYPCLLGGSKHFAAFRPSRSVFRRDGNFIRGAVMFLVALGLVLTVLAMNPAVAGEEKRPVRREGARGKDQDLLQGGPAGVVRI